MVCAVATARADEVDLLVEHYLERLRGNAIAALRQAISDALADGVECRRKLEAAERAVSSGFMRQIPATFFE